MRIYLTGFMGAGKTTVGRLLAAELDCSFIDLDEAVAAAAGRSIEDIFATAGEGAFRRFEAEALRRTGDFAACVVATGGGTPAGDANRRWMGQRGTVVWLSAPLESLLERVGAGSGRPLWGDEGKLRTLYFSRLDAYRECDLEIDASRAGPGEVAREIVARLEAAGLR